MNRQNDDEWYKDLGPVALRLARFTDMVASPVEHGKAVERILREHGFQIVRDVEPKAPPDTGRVCVDGGELIDPARTFVETDHRIWRMGSLMLSQAQASSPYQLWGVRGQSSNGIVHRYSIDEFETMEEATDFANKIFDAQPH